MQRQQQQTQRTTITQDYPWKIQQVQDAANHLQQAINHIDNVDSSYNFKTSDEVLHILGNILGALQRGRTSLVVPRKKPIDELMKSRNMKALSPNLPEDLAISFYIQSHKLIFVAYQLTNFQGTMKFDSCQAECSVPWLNEVLVLFTVALQLCQQLKDKVFNDSTSTQLSMLIFLSNNRFQYSHSTRILPLVPGRLPRCPIDWTIRPPRSHFYRVGPKLGQDVSSM